MKQKKKEEKMSKEKMKMTPEIRKTLEVIINHYELDIQWWGNDEEEQAYADVNKIREWLKEERECELMKKRFHLKALSEKQFNSIGKLPVDDVSSKDSYYQYLLQRRYFILKKRISNTLSKNKRVMDDDKFEFIRLCKDHKLPMIFRFE